MDDAHDRLTTDEQLFRLLDHYADTAGKDRVAWADRVMAWDVGTPADLTRWHGALLAAAWVEVNVGTPATISAGRVPACYRLTPAGRQALQSSAHAPRACH
jgi:hypothetical protein